VNREQGDLKAYGESAHKLKGAAGNVGAKAIMLHCRRLQCVATLPESEVPNLKQELSKLYFEHRCFRHTLLAMLGDETDAAS
jgi:HPt (histidine-containing phosphotransfer) domain-containing protein